MRSMIAYAVAVLVVISLCGIAMTVTGRDNDCTDRGGHVRGVFGQECVIP